MLKPNPHQDLIKFQMLLQKKIPFIFIRFSDGETEILRNRPLIIDKNQILFRGRKLKNIYPKHDFKNFHPTDSQIVRADLLKSAMHCGFNFFKGIPTRHNNAILDREFMLRLNGGLDKCITFSDLFMNSNYEFFRNNIIEEFKQFKYITIIANHRARFGNFLKHANHIKIPDNFFSCYEKSILDINNQIDRLPFGSLILSSASSLSNIIGYQLHKKCPKKFTFIDIGSSMNDFIGLHSNVRTYHLLNNKGLRTFILKNIYKLSKNYKIQW